MFEWDARKAAENPAKHGVAFDEAATVFADPDALDGPDVRHSDAEARFLRLGWSVFSWWPTRSGVQTMAKRFESSVRVARAAKKERRTGAVRRIDFSDIPEASDEQLRGMRRVGRPPLGDAARQLIAIRLDPNVLKRFRTDARRRNVGYQTLINRVLADYVSKNVA